MNLIMNNNKKVDNDNSVVIKAPQLSGNGGTGQLLYSEWVVAMNRFLTGMGLAVEDYQVKIEHWEDINKKLELENKELAAKGADILLGRYKPPVPSTPAKSSSSGSASPATEEAQALKAIKDQMKRIAKAYTIIMNSLDVELSKQVEGVPVGYAYALWNWLEKKFLTTDVDAVAQKISEFYTMRMSETETFELWKLRVDEGKKGLEYMKEKVSEAAYISILLHHVTPNYHSPKATLAASLALEKKSNPNATYDWAYVVEFMRLHENQNMTSNSGDSYDSALAMAATKGSSSSSSSSYQNNNYQTANYKRKGHYNNKPNQWVGPVPPDMECFTCHEKGHVKQQCPIWLKNQEKLAKFKAKKFNLKQPGSGSDNESSEGKPRPSYNSHKAQAAVQHKNKYSSISSEEEEEEQEEGESKGYIKNMNCAAIVVERKSSERVLAAVNSEFKEDEEQPYRQAPRIKNQVSNNNQSNLTFNSRTSTRIIPRQVPSPPSSSTAPSVRPITPPSAPPKKVQEAKNTHLKGKNPHNRTLDEALASTSWGIDTMASVHCSGNDKMIHSITRCTPVTIQVADGVEIECNKKGKLNLRIALAGTEKKLLTTIEDVYYHERFATNLLSCGLLKKLDWELHITKASSYLLTPGKNKAILSTRGNVFVIDNTSKERVFVSREVTFSSIVNRVTKAKHLERLHRMLGHVSFERLLKIAKGGQTEGLKEFNLSPVVMKEAKERIENCTACLMGKGSRTPIGNRGLDHGRAPGEVIHMDSFQVRSKDKVTDDYVATYALLAVEPHSEHRWSYSTGRKDALAQSVIDMLESSTTMTGKRVKLLITDGGSEFKNEMVRSYLADHGITHRVSPPGEPRLNGIAEASVQTSKDAVRTMLTAAGLSDKYWQEALAHHTFLWNRTRISRATGKTPYESMRGKKASIEHLGIFGCDIFAHRSKQVRHPTFAPKMLPGIYLGHSTTYNVPLVMPLDGERAFPTRDVEFRPDSFIHSEWKEAGRGKELAARGYYRLTEAPTENPNAIPTDSLDSNESSNEDEVSESEPISELKYEVEEIVNRRTRANKIEYRVKWKGYPTEDNSWEPISNLTEASDAIALYEAKDKEIQERVAKDSRLNSLRSASSSSKPQVHSVVTKEEPANVTPTRCEATTTWAARFVGAARHL